MLFTHPLSLRAENLCYEGVTNLGGVQSWFDVNKCGLAHLEAAKHILLARQQCNPLPSILVHALWWLETLVSFVSDYKGTLYTSPRAYLDDLTHRRREVTELATRGAHQADPFLGTWKSLVRHIACLGSLIQRLLRGKPTDEDESLAEAIEMNLLECDLLNPWGPGLLLSDPQPMSPPKEYDPSWGPDPTAYSAYAAESHRQAALLILYQHFPDLLARRARLVSQGGSAHQFLANLAKSVVRLLRHIPLTSRLWLISSIPLLCVGQWVDEAEDPTFLQSVYEMLSLKVSLYNVTAMFNMIKDVREQSNMGDLCSWVNVLFRRGDIILVG